MASVRRQCARILDGIPRARGGAKGSVVAPVWRRVLVACPHCGAVYSGTHYSDCLAHALRGSCPKCGTQVHWSGSDDERMPAAIGRAILVWRHERDGENFRIKVVNGYHFRAAEVAVFSVRRILTRVVSRAVASVR